ncbi:MAG: hypothetical protein AB7T06_04390 [Kofleriaceae bacterium]
MQPLLVMSRVIDAPRAEVFVVEDGARTRWTLEQSIARSCWTVALDRLHDLLDAETGVHA